MPFEKILSQKELGLRELFRNSKNPVEVILQEMDSDKIKEFIDISLLDEVKNKLNELTFKDENEFVSKILEIGQPIWDITQKDKQDLFKQPNREMFTIDDIKETVKNIQETKAQKIYVVGNVGSGKSTFARELAGQTNFKNIDLDHFFQIYRQEKNKEANLSELLNFVLEREEPPYIINHADLLSYNLDDRADMVILLNPKKEEQIKSRRIRQENKTDGEWQNVNVDDYDKISQENLNNLAKTRGEIVYNNNKSGTIIKVLENKSTPDLNNEDYIGKVFESGTKEELEKITSQYNFTTEEIRIFSHYAKLRRNILDEMRPQIENRRQNNPKATEDELSLGAYQESIEPQVRQTVFDLRKKGYATYESGFSGFDRQTISFEKSYLENFKIPAPIVDKFKEQGIIIEVKPSRIKLIFEKEFNQEDLANFWQEIENYFPDLGEPAPACQLNQAVSFRKRQKNLTQ